MEYKIPQNIDIEDKIVGPLTLRQFVILLIGSGLSFLFYLVFGEVAPPIFVILTILTAGISVGLAFVDYGGKHMETILLDALASLGRPKRMVWRRDAADVRAEMEKYSDLQAKEMAKPEVPIVVEKEDFNQTRERLRAAANQSDSQMNQVQFSGTEDAFEKENPFLENTLNQKAESIKREEPLLSQVATVNPNQKFEYPKIETNKRKFL